MVQFPETMVVSSATIINRNCHPINPCLIHSTVHTRTSNLFRNHKYRQVTTLQVVPSSIPFASVSVSRDTQQSLPESADFVSTVGTPQLVPTSLKTWNMTDRHLMLLNGIACIVAVSASCLFFAAIPTLMALKRAAESMEKLLDVMREELPGTMAAVRLSGMEISDLTMELSDLGQEITEGVRNSTRAVRAAEDGLRRMTNMASVALLQEREKVQDNIMKPAMARTARGLHDGIVQGRSILKSLGTLRQLTGWLRRYWIKRKNLSSKEK